MTTIKCNIGLRRKGVTGKPRREQSGWALIETIVSMALFSLTLTSSLSALRAVQHSSRLQQEHATANRELRNIANWIRVQSDETLTRSEHLTPPASVFPSASAPIQLDDLEVSVTVVNEEDDELRFYRFEIEAKWLSMGKQTAHASLTTWRAWPHAE